MSEEEKNYYCPVCKRNHIQGRGDIYEDHLQFKGMTKKMPENTPHYRQIPFVILMENQANIKWDNEMISIPDKIRSLNSQMKQELYGEAINRLYTEGWKYDHRYVRDDGKVIIVFEDID